MNRPIKVALTQILAFGLICFAALMAKAQTNDTGIFGQIGGQLDKSGIFDATNYAFDLYGTYAESAPKGQRYGGGIWATYNVTDKVGLGLAGDYLGQFTMVSATVTLKMPIQPFKSFQNSFLTNITVIPLVYGGVGTPFSGSPSGTAIAITGEGGAIQFGHIWGGKFNAGFTRSRWDGAGIFSGYRDHLFAGLSFGF